MWTDPSDAEVGAFLESAFTMVPGARVMIDTASGYGLSERNVGRWLSQHEQHKARAYIASKFGEEYNCVTGETTLDLTSTGALRQFRHSVELLGKVELLYSHLTSQISDEQAIAVLGDVELTKQLTGLKARGEGGLQLLGVSISHPKALREAMEAGQSVDRSNATPAARSARRALAV